MSNPIQIADARRARLPRLVPSFAPSISNDYTEFLPAHLEILETPATPKMAFMIWTLCGLLTAGIAWSCLAKIDIYAEAQGRIQPSGRSKVVQPVDTGRVRTIAVSNGSKVKAGDLLIALDPTESSADRDAARSEMDSLVSEIARRKAEIAAVQANVDNPVLTLPDTVPADVADRDQKLFRAEMNQYVGTRETLDAQVAEKTARNERLKETIGPRERMIALMQERVNMRSTLESSQSGTHAAVIDASQVLQNELRNLADDKGQVLENNAATVSLQRQLDQTKSDFLATQNQHLTDAVRRESDVAQNLIKANVREQRTRLVAPIDGVVQQLAVTTVGQVVTIGQPLMVVVPSDAPLEVMALIENKDVGFIKPGQEVVVKVDSFPFTRYGTLNGTVKRISMEAIDSQEATATSDASTLARPTNNSSLASTPRVQNLVYPVSIELQRTSLRVDDQQVPLLPGMTVTSEVRTGSRRVISYLLAPIWEASSQAAHER